MCGIAGFCINAEEHIDARALAKSLLKGIEARGKDATGAAWYNAKRNQVQYIKNSKPATQFCEKEAWQIPSGVKNVILHTRWATQGTPKHNTNNHPIVIGNFVGVHNGHISNDAEILKFARDHYGHRRIGEVDSEAAFALAKYAEDPLEAFAEAMDGRAALAWIDGNRPRELNVTRVTGSPLVAAQTPGGSFIFASTEPILRKAMKDVGLKVEWLVDMSEYEYMKVKNGAVIEYTDYAPAWVKEMKETPMTQMELEYGAWLKSVM